MDSNVELPLELKLRLERINRYIADLKDIDKLRELAIEATKTSETTKYLINLLVADVIKNETQWKRRLALVEQKCAIYEAFFVQLEARFLK